MSVSSQVFRSGLRRVQSIDAMHYVASMRNGARRVRMCISSNKVDVQYIHDILSSTNLPDGEISEHVFTEIISIWDPVETILCDGSSCKDS